MRPRVTRNLRSIRLWRRDLHGNSMTWKEAVDVVSAQRNTKRFAELCHQSNPQHEYWRKRVIGLALGVPPEGAHYPSAQQQARNLWVSLKRFVRSGGELAPKAERARRLAICLGCDKYDQAQKRCRVCGCKNSAKVWLASDRCPLDPPKWTAIGPPASPSSSQ
jgi:hypothetical protein